MTPCSNRGAPATPTGAAPPSLSCVGSLMRLALSAAISHPQYECTSAPVPVALLHHSFIAVITYSLASSLVRFQGQPRWSHDRRARMFAFVLVCHAVSCRPCHARCRFRFQPPVQAATGGSASRAWEDPRRAEDSSPAMHQAVSSASLQRHYRHCQHTPALPCMPTEVPPTKTMATTT